MEYEEDIRPNVIIDNGTGYCKAGLSDQSAPMTVFPSVIGYPKYERGPGMEAQNYIGPDAIQSKGVLNLSYPIEHGVVNNWDEMENIWGYIFTNELRVDPVEHNVLVTEASLNPIENKEKIAQIMFETFNVPNLFIAVQATLSLYSEGKTTGIVVDSGDGVTHIVPIFERYSLPHAITRLDLAGRDLTNYMIKLLTEIGTRFSTSSEREIAKSIKEKTCYIALDYDKESNKVEDYIYELPDGNTICLREQRIKCPEALFKPSLIGKEDLGISNALYSSIQKCDIDIKRDLYHNIILSGGNSMYNGIKERLEKEIKELAPEGMRLEIRVFASENRKFSVFEGGTILSNLLTVNEWISKTDYEENGVIVVKRKCF